MRKERILLTAGFDKAKHVYALAELLRRDGLLISGILVVSPFSTKRVRALIRQRGKSFLWEAIPRMIGSKNQGGRTEKADPFADFLSEKKIVPKSLSGWAKENKVPYKAVKSINDEQSVGFVKSVNPDWVAYGGGGILHNAFIDASKGKILNAHSGPLPEIRGMNACEWSLLLGNEPAVTIHLINRGIDTGGIISSHSIDVQPSDTIDTLRSRCVTMGVQALYQTLTGPQEFAPQVIENAAAHRQCFVLSPAMKELLAKRLDHQVYSHLYQS